VRTDISLRTAPLTHSNPAKAVEGGSNRPGRGHAAPVLSLGLDISGAAKATFEGHHVLGADALHESLEREAHMRNRYGGHHEIILAVD
jgi:hypothetical protein